jgi:uncharacterized cupredoxin-like copper-binding protein
LLVALTTNQKIGFLVFAGIFIGFALLSAMVIPRFRPNYPARGLPLFLLGTVILFGAMFTAVLVFGRESEEAEAHGGSTAAETATTTAPTTTAPTTTTQGAQTVVVDETEFKITLPGGETQLKAGTYDFEAKNSGKIDHDLVIDGPGVSKQKTPVYPPGKTESLTVTLKSGTYEFYCSVPGHKQAGMDLKVTVS